jgi:hypothetical protein
MSKFIVSLLIWGLFIGHAFARYGETPEQFAVRYGIAITNLPACADVEWVAIHSKDDLFITAIFLRDIDGKARARFIFYSRSQPFSPFPSSGPDMTQEDETVILATIKGQWTLETPAKTLAGPKYFGGNANSMSRVMPNNSIPDKKSIGFSSGILADTGDKVSKAVQEVLHVIYPHNYSYTTSLISHNGPKLFAFRALHGVAICTAEKIPSISGWTNFIRGQNAKPVPKPITGI